MHISKQNLQSKLQHLSFYNQYCHNYYYNTNTEVITQLGKFLVEMQKVREA